MATQPMRAPVEFGMKYREPSWAAAWVGLLDGTKGPEVTSGDRLALLWRRVKEHRIAQWTIGYVAVAYGIQHAVTLTSEALDWPHAVDAGVLFAARARLAGCDDIGLVSRRARQSAYLRGQN